MKKGDMLRRSFEALAAVVIVISIVVYSFAVLSGITDQTEDGQGTVTLAVNGGVQAQADIPQTDQSSGDNSQRTYQNEINSSNETKTAAANTPNVQASAGQGVGTPAVAQASNTPDNSISAPAGSGSIENAAAGNSTDGSNIATAAMLAEEAGEKFALEQKAREPVYKYVEIEELNIRSGTGSDTAKLDELVKCTRIQLMQQAEKWLEILTPDNKKGYVFAEYTGDTKPPVYNYVSVDKVNVRKGAGSDTEKLDTIYQGTRIQVLEVLDKWINIITPDNVEGYVYAEYVSDKKPVVYKYINSSTLNVRKGPDTETKKVATVQAGDKVQFLETKGEWSRIKTSSNVEGYVKTKYVVNSQTQVSRAAESAPQPHNADLATQVLEYAQKYLGVKYVYGGGTPKGFDCSGFTRYVFAHFNIDVPRSAAEYYSTGTKISRNDIKPGDLVLLDRYWNNELGHVGIYMGNDKFIHASSKKGKVVIAKLSEYSGTLLGIRRVLK